MAFAPVAALALSAVGGIAGFIGAKQQAAAQETAANYQAQVARNNQVIAQQNAQYQATAAAARAQAEDLKTRSVVGAVEAAQGASGITFDSPTLEQIRSSQEQVGRLSSRTTYDEGLQAARTSAQQGEQFGAEAQLSTLQASNARTAGNIGGFTSLLSGATSFADKWARFKYAGVPGFGD